MTTEGPFIAVAQSIQDDTEMSTITDLHGNIICYNCNRPNNKAKDCLHQFNKGTNRECIYVATRTTKLAICLKTVQEDTRDKTSALIAPPGKCGEYGFYLALTRHNVLHLLYFSCSWTAVSRRLRKKGQNDYITVELGLRFIQMLGIWLRSMSW